MIDTSIAKLKSWLIFVWCCFLKNMGTSCYKCKFENVATDWENRDRSVVVNTLFFDFFVNWYDICYFFHSDGKMPCVRQDLKIIWKSLRMDLSHNLSTQILVTLSPWALFTSRLLESDLSVIKEEREGVLLILLSINKQCVAKKLKS